MYKIFHLPTATFVKCNPFRGTGWVDWEFVSLDSAQKVMNWDIIVDYEKEFVCLEGSCWMKSPGKVLLEHLEIIEDDSW